MEVREQERSKVRHGKKAPKQTIRNTYIKGIVIIHLNHWQRQNWNKTETEGV